MIKDERKKMKPIFKKLLMTLFILAAAACFILGLVHLKFIISLISRLFVFLFDKFEGTYRVKIAKISAFVVFCGMFALLFKKGWEFWKLDQKLSRIIVYLKRVITKYKKLTPLAGAVLVGLNIWIILSIAFPYAFIFTAALITCLLLKFRNDKKKLYILAIIIILLFFAPYIFQGQDTHIKIFDNLDAHIPQLKILAESGKAFSFNPDTKINNIINGINLSGLDSGYNVITWLFIIFKPFTAYSINIFIMSFTAFWGMVLLLRKYVLKSKSEKHTWMIFGSSLCFSILPFYPTAGISVAGLPLLFYSFLNIINDEGKKIDYGVIIFFPFYSRFVLVGIFIIFILGVLFLIDLFKKRRINLGFFWGLLLLTVFYLFTNFHLIYSYIAPDFSVHREEIAASSVSTGECMNQAIHNFIFDRTNDIGAQQVFVMLALAAAVIIGVTKKVKKFNFLVIFVLIAAINSILWGFKYWEGMAFLREKFQFLTAFNFARFYCFNPFIWYIIFALSLLIISKIKYGKQLVSALIILQLLFLFTNYNWEYRYLLGRKNHLKYSLTYKEFYSEELFKRIDHFINKPKQDYRVVSVGIHPGIAQYNGFYTLDIYSNIYPLEYKHKFRRIIEKELEKSEDVRRVFDDNAKRCYLLSAELHNDKRRGLTFARGITKKQGHLKIKKLELNTTALKEMGGEYIFSAVEILNHAETGLSFERAFETNDSPWKIYVYKVI